MSYVDKYIKNLKPSDLSLSLWGGDVVLYNLELRLDVLEKVRKIVTSVLVLMSTSFSDKPSCKDTNVLENVAVHGGFIDNEWLLLVSSGEANQLY